MRLNRPQLEESSEASIVSSLTTQRRFRGMGPAFTEIGTQALNIAKNGAQMQNPIRCSSLAKGTSSSCKPGSVHSQPRTCASSLELFVFSPYLHRTKCTSCRLYHGRQMKAISYSPYRPKPQSAAVLPCMSSHDREIADICVRQTHRLLT